MSILSLAYSASAVKCLRVIAFVVFFSVDCCIVSVAFIALMRLLFNITAVFSHLDHAQCFYSGPLFPLFFPKLITPSQVDVQEAYVLLSSLCCFLHPTFLQVKIQSSTNSWWSGATSVPSRRIHLENPS